MKRQDTPGNSNIDTFNATRGSKKEKQVREVLNQLRASRPRIEEWTDLVQEVARRTGIAESTFTRNRNQKFRALLFEFLAELPGSVRSIDPMDADRNMLLAQLLDARLRIKELERKANRQIKMSRSAQGNEREPHIAFEDTAKLLQMVIARSENVIQLDEPNKLVIDRMAPHKNRVIGEPPRTDAFFRWLRNNRS